jgi:hypothetical protein
MKRLWNPPLRVQCDDCGATKVAYSLLHLKQEQDHWMPDDDFDNDIRIWRCGRCWDAWLRRARIIEDLEDGDYVPPASTAGWTS